MTVKDEERETRTDTDVLDDFWAMIDDEIEAGKLPPIREKK